MTKFSYLLPFSLLATLTAPVLNAETVKLTLLGVGDVYNFAEEDGRGGFARLNAVARAELDYPAVVVGDVRLDLADPRLELRRVGRYLDRQVAARAGFRVDRLVIDEPLLTRLQPCRGAERGARGCMEGLCEFEKQNWAAAQGKLIACREIMAVLDY